MPIRPQCFKALYGLRDQGTLDPSSAYEVLDRFYPDAQAIDSWWSPDGVSVTVHVQVGDRYDQEQLTPAPPQPLTEEGP